MKQQTMKDLFKHLMIRHGKVSLCQTEIFSYGSLRGGHDPIMTCREKKNNAKCKQQYATNHIVIMVIG